MGSSNVQSNVSVIVYLIGVPYFDAHILSYITNFQAITNMQVNHPQPKTSNSASGASSKVDVSF